MPLPKVIPTKILAQFEQESLKMSSPYTKKEGVDKLYLSVVDKKASQLDKVVDKKEANVQPHLTYNSTVKYAEKKNKNSS